MNGLTLVPSISQKARETAPASRSSVIVVTFHRAMLRLGLCCLFLREPIRFRALTAKYLLSLPKSRRPLYVSNVCLHNSRSLLEAVETVSRLGIGAFRVMSPLFPRITHPEVGYRIEDLPDGERIFHHLSQVRTLARKNRIRLSFHPDLFILLSSPNKDVTENSIRELEYQGFVAEKIGAQVINIHGGGEYEDKKAALMRVREHYRYLSPRVRKRLTLENDDRVYSVRDLLPVCSALRIPLVYDVHHHRCRSDDLSVEEATRSALLTWEPRRQDAYFHISSPRNGWSSGDPRSHADYIDPRDFPVEWKDLNLTVDVEAKAKELAVIRLMKSLRLDSPAPVGGGTTRRKGNSRACSQGIDTNRNQ